jgi:hypothetical protein
MALNKFPEIMRQRFEASLAQSLALNLAKNDFGEYTSAKTGNLFLAFCYGWYRGEGLLEQLPGLVEELVRRA